MISQGFTTQGRIEEVTSRVYGDWKHGAVLGIEYACQLE
jgi:hypothetical protein